MQGSSSTCPVRPVASALSPFATQTSHSGYLSAVKSTSAAIPPILHFSAQQLFTKYTITELFARLHHPPLDLGDNLVRVSVGPKPGETIRPRDCHLSNVRQFHNALGRTLTLRRRARSVRSKHSASTRTLSTLSSGGQRTSRRRELLSTSLQCAAAVRDCDGRIAFLED